MKMAAQFLLNLFIAFLWVLFKDESVFQFTTFVAGVMIGIIIVFTMRRFFGGRFYLHRLYSVFKLILIFISETLQSAEIGRASCRDRVESSRGAARSKISIGKRCT